MKNGDIREVFLQMSKAITTKTKAVTTQAQAMTTQANREVVPRGNKYAGTMASPLKDITRMNLLTFYGSNVEEYPRDFIDDIYKILYPMGLVDY